MKTLKRLLLCIMVVAAFAAGYVSADDVKVISLNRAVTGKPQERKADTYMIKVPARGKLNINLKHKNLFDKETYWTVQVLADDLETVLQEFNSAGTDKNLTGPTLGLSKGSYYVRVYARKDCSHKYSDVPYTMTPKFAKSSQWEIEWNAAAKRGNDKQGTATAMTAGKIAYGTVSSSSDIDFFKIKIKNNGYIKLTFTHPNIYEKDVYWKAQVVNNKANVLYEISSIGTKKSQSSTELGVTPGDYYVRVTGNGNTCSSRNYGVKVAFVKTSSWEQEYTSKTGRNNDSMGNANLVVSKKPIYGTLYGINDKDYFKFSVAKSRVVGFGFTHVYKTSRNKFWEISIYDSKLNKLYSFTSRGTDVNLARYLYLKKGTYFAKISVSTKYSGIPYKLTVV